MLRFAMPGHDFLGYTLWGIAVLVLLCPRLHRVGRTVLSVLVCAGLIVFAVFEIPVVRDARTDTGAHPNAIIVLGAGVNGSTPSLSMCNRLDAALDYLGANPDAMAVVSGGQGEGEDITEAEAMADYLDGARHRQRAHRAGGSARAPHARIWKIRSPSSARAAYDPADGVGIVTSEYHLCRAKRMARALGAEPVGIAAETTLPSMRINYFIREAFAAAYMQLAGTLY
ncbi:MAG: YdcF family protein [Oscillospiraceae bacterium]